MGRAATQLPLLGESGGDAEGARLRREGREQIVRHVEYTAFPRVSAHQRERVGFTRDVSASGMCLRAEAAEPIGSLLRLVTHRLDGRPAEEAIGRVVWCSPTADGAVWLGLSVLERGRQVPVRVPARRAAARAVTPECA